MVIYFATLALVMLFGGIANRVDVPHDGEECTGRTKHSGLSLLFYLLAAIILICVAGLRYYVGTDYGSYYHRYSQYADNLWEYTKTLSEPGYAIIAVVARFIWDDGAGAVFLISVVTIGLSLLVIYRNSQNLFLGLTFFVLLGVWDATMNGYRQPLAAAVLLCGYPYLRDRDFKRYLLIVLIAFLCHRSAIVMIALYFVMGEKYSVSRVAILVVAAIILSFSIDFIFDFTGWLLDDDVDRDNEYVGTTVNILRILVACAPAILFIILYWKREKSKEVTQSLYMLVVHGGISVATAFSAFIARLTLYTSPFLVFALPALLYPLPKKTRTVATVAMLCCYALFWWYDLTHSSSYIPFRWIWER